MIMLCEYNFACSEYNMLHRLIRLPALHLTDFYNKTCKFLKIDLFNLLSIQEGKCKMCRIAK